MYTYDDKVKYRFTNQGDIHAYWMLDVLRRLDIIDWEEYTHSTDGLWQSLDCT